MFSAGADIREFGTELATRSPTLGEVIDAAENEAAGIEQMKFYEVGPNISLTAHSITVRPLAFSGKTLRRLPEDLQVAIIQAGNPNESTTDLEALRQQYTPGTDEPQLDFVEIFNPGPSPVDLAGIVLLAAGTASARPGTGSDSRIDGSHKILPLPYLNYNRSIGFQYGAIPMVLFNPVRSDTLSPSSVVGGFLMGSENKTWFAMGFTMLYFDQDNWRFLAAGGTGSVNFQFFLDSPVNSWIPYNTEADIFYACV